MSILDKQRLIKDLKTSLYDKLKESEVDTVCEALMSVLNNCDLTYTNTENDYNINTEYIQMFLDAKLVEGRSKKTLRHYAFVLNCFFNVERVAVTDVNVFHIRDYFMKEKKRGIADTTISSVRSVLSSFFVWMVNEGLIDRNPCANVGKIKCRKEVKLPFSKDELQLIQDNAISDRDRALVTFLASTGCRISEVCALNVEDVNIRDMECTVLGKGNKERTVYIDEVARLYLKRYLAKRDDMEAPLFVSKRKERLSQEGVRFILDGISERSGVTNIHPHRFRRTLATNLIARGMPIQDVAKILGHERIDTTMTYVYINKGQIKNAYRQYTA